MPLSLDVPMPALALVTRGLSSPARCDSTNRNAEFTNRNDDLFREMVVLDGELSNRKGD